MRIMLDTNVILSMALFPSKRFGEMLEYIMRHYTLVLSAKDFKEIPIEKPDIMTPSEFIEIYM